MAHQYKDEVPYELMTENDSKLFNDDHEEKIGLNETNPLPESQVNIYRLFPFVIFNISMNCFWFEIFSFSFFFVYANQHI